VRTYAGDRGLFNKLSVPLASQTAVTSAGGMVDLQRSFMGVGLQYLNTRRLGEGRLTTVVGSTTTR
jgi:iron complex outermembrane receptor protein